MKKNIFNKLILGASILTVVGYSCKEDFLTVLPTGSVSQAQLTSKKGLEGALIAAYGQLGGYGNRMAGPSNWVFGSIRGGDANKGTDPGDYQTINPIQRFEYLATNNEFNENYRGNYEGVARSNSVLALVKSAQADVSADDKKRIEGEARFLRGHFYFQLKRNFNNTPYADETMDIATISALKNDVELWPKIEADFKAAYESLPETQAQSGRANKWAAASYLAKTYMYQKKFTEAKALFDLIIANGKTTNGKKYGLVAKYPDIYKASNDNHEESVFACQAAANTGSVNNANAELDLNFIQGSDPGGCCGFFQPSFEFVNSFRTKDGLPLLDGSYNSDANAVKNDMGLASDKAFTTDAGDLDPRLDHSVGRRDIPFLDWGKHKGFSWIRNQSNGGPYSPKKYLYYKTDKGTFQDNSSWTAGYTALNITIIRYADVLLMAAEAEVEVGSLEKAREYVNMVRNRAANAFVMDGDAPAAKYVIKPYDTAWASKDAARAAVRFERKLELGMEGHRFYDLVRWGIDVTEINNYLKYDSKFLPGTLGGAGNGAGYTAKNAICPIPQSQIDLTGADILKQNPGY